MAAHSIVTLGFGPSAGTGFIPTLGFGVGAAVTPPAEPSGGGGAHVLRRANSPATVGVPRLRLGLRAYDPTVTAQLQVRPPALPVEPAVPVHLTYAEPPVQRPRPSRPATVSVPCLQLPASLRAYREEELLFMIAAMEFHGGPADGVSRIPG